MAPSTAAGSTSVQVALRIRPQTAQDNVSIPARFQRTVLHAATATTVNMDAVTATPASGGAAAASAGAGGAGVAAVKKQAFTFDQVHAPETTQHAMFTATAQPLIGRFLDGFNCTILAYGQTSSGKTFTMTGADLDKDPADPSNAMGIVPRAVALLFQRARELKEDKGAGWNYSIKGSFIEIYNEDLVDLLSPDGRSGSNVQIRESKDGHILWEGLREVGVKNSAEVMSLIRQGTSIRRTNETDMNAQSSRSHAIFSLTLTQRKYTGSGQPQRSPSPLPGQGRSPSRLTRPGSLFTNSPSRVSSPTFDKRPGTPTSSFASAMGRGGSQRPASSLGIHLDTPKKQGGDDDGQWVTIVSKFHFVDLAGSERLKRTAAAGERIKEGISINGGLLALGNVISALGDPARAKSNTASYVPYRDSKLTRLLQDSLGGNAHTLMIACVSAAEWNAAETLNTLKYANRARNIKNRASIDVKEEGWDDVEWLQATVTRLRAQIKTVKDGGALPAPAPGEPQPDAPANKKLQASLEELRQNYEELREQYDASADELIRLRREHGEHVRSATTGTVPGMSKYEEIVGPVIEEYEKSLSNLETQLQLSRAALTHTNNIYDEKEAELQLSEDQRQAAELQTEELRARLAKLQEREASTEAYVRDLEERLRATDEGAQGSAEGMLELRRELARVRDAESQSAAYIAELEARLGRADESVLSLRATVERLEADAERRTREIGALNGRLDDFARDGAAWRADLEAREKKVRDLEARLEEWEAERKAAGEERARLRGAVAEAAASAPGSGASTPSTQQTHRPGDEDARTSGEVLALREAQVALVADLAATTDKYRDALREIADLASQISELKLASAAPSIAASEPALETPVSTPGGRRRLPREPSGSLSAGAGGRRLFFRNAASSESLHSRSLSQSQSLSQELSSAHSRKASSSSPSSPGSSTGSVSHRPNLSISLPHQERSAQSLEKEIMRLQEVLRARDEEIAALERAVPKLPAVHPLTEEPDAHGLNGNGAGMLSPPASEADGEAFLSPMTVARFESIRNGMQHGSSVGGESHGGHARSDSVSVSNLDPDENLERLNELMRAMAQKESTHREIVDDLNGQLKQIRRQHDELQVLSSNQTMNMSRELESLRGYHEADLASLEKVQARETELTAALEEARAAHTAAQTEHATNVEALRAEHEAALRHKETELDALVARLNVEHDALVARLKTDHGVALADHDKALSSAREEHAAALAKAAEEHDATRAELAAATAALEKAQAEHTAAFGALRADHAAELQGKLGEAAALLEAAKAEHAAAAAAHAAVLKEHGDESARTEEEYYNGLTKLRTEHADALAARTVDAQRATEEHAAALKAADAASAAALAEARDAHARVLEGIKEEHSQALARKEQALAEELTRREDAHGALVARLEEEHAAALRIVEIARQGSVSDSEEARARIMADLADEHAAALARKDAAYAEDTERAKAEHARAFAAAATEHAAQLEGLRAEHATALSDLASRHAAELAEARDAAEAAQREHDAAVQGSRAEADAALQTVKEQQAAILREVAAGHHDELEKLVAKHQARADDAAAKLAAERAALGRAHDEERAALAAEHERAMGAALAERAAAVAEAKDEAERERAALVQAHADALEAARSSHAAALDAAHAEHAAARDEAVRQAQVQAEAEHAALGKSHADRALAAQAEHAAAVQAARDEAQAERERLVQEHRAHVLAHDKAVADLNAALEAEQEARRAHGEQASAGEKERLARAVAELEDVHAREREVLLKDQELLRNELAMHKAAAEEHAAAREQDRAEHEQVFARHSETISNLHQDLSDAHNEREELAHQIQALQAALGNKEQEQAELVQEASKRHSLVEELDRHRSILAETQRTLQRVRDEKDAIQEEKDAIAEEKAKQEASVRELQAQLARVPSPDVLSSPILSRPPGERQSTFSRINGHVSKLPPPTPPPSVPPPPAPQPRASEHHQQASFASSTPVSVTSSRDSEALDSPATSVTPSIPHPPAALPDPKLLSQIEEQGRTIEEQEVMIKTLNKQLTHCESDLQAHMDLVTTLETSLGDSEKNLRKARMQATELARERDTLNGQIDTLRSDLTVARREVVTVRQSIVEEKQSLEQRLEDERRQKEKARVQLDSRMEEMQKRKSKFVCL